MNLPGINGLKRLFNAQSEVDTSPNKVTPEQVYPDDVYLVSYPKSGNTWSRFLVGNYISNNQCDFTTCHDLVPDLYRDPGNCDGLERPRFMKSHAPYFPAYPNVIYIVRDGRDAAVSYYFHAQKMGAVEEGISFPAFMDLFNSGELGRFGTWNDHVLGWLDASDVNLHVVRYEDMLANTQGALRDMLTFAGLNVDDERVHEAVQASDFGSMRKKRVQRIETTGEAPILVRKGRQGDWSNYFDNALHDEFLAVHGTALKRLGYV